MKYHATNQARPTGIDQMDGVWRLGSRVLVLRLLAPSFGVELLANFPTK